MGAAPCPRGGGVRAGRGWEGRGGGGDRLKGTRGPFKDPGVLLKDPRVLLKDPGALLKDPGALLKDPGVLSKDPGDLLKDPGVLLKGSRGGGGGVGRCGGPRPKNNWSSLADPICFLQLRMQPVLFKYCLVVKDPGVHLKDLLRNHPSKNAQRGVLNEMVIWGGRFFGPVVK